MSLKYSSLTFFTLLVLCAPAAADARYKGDVAGWIPWWSSEDGLEEVIDNIDDLDIIYPFIYEIEGTGTIVEKVNIDRGIWEELLEEAEDQRVEIIPTIAWFDGPAMHVTLSNKRLRKQLIEDIEELVDDNDFDEDEYDFDFDEEDLEEDEFDDDDDDAFDDDDDIFDDEDLEEIEFEGEDDDLFDDEDLEEYEFDDDDDFDARLEEEDLDDYEFDDEDDFIDEDEEDDDFIDEEDVEDLFTS